MSSLRRFALAAGLVLLAGCPAATSTDTAADEQAIRATLDAWNLALTSGNDSLLATLYTDDALLTPPGMPRVAGREAIRAFWASLWPMKATLTMSPVRFVISGDLAVEEGNWTWSMPLPAGEERDQGKYLHTWRREDGNWRVSQNIWNSDLRAPAPAPR